MSILYHNFSCIALRLSAKFKEHSSHFVRRRRRRETSSAFGRRQDIFHVKPNSTLNSNIYLCTGRLHIQHSRTLRKSRFSKARDTSTRAARRRTAQNSGSHWSSPPVRGARGDRGSHRSEVGDSNHSNQFRQTSNRYVRASGGSPPPTCVPLRALFLLGSAVDLNKGATSLCFLSTCARSSPRHVVVVDAAYARPFVRVNCHASDDVHEAWYVLSLSESCAVTRLRTLETRKLRGSNPWRWSFCPSTPVSILEHARRNFFGYIVFLGYVARGWISVIQLITCHIRNETSASLRLT